MVITARCIDENDMEMEVKAFIQKNRPAYFRPGGFFY